MSSSRPSVTLPEEATSGELGIDLPSGCRFGVCLTHDVDHLGLREHLVDGFLLRYAFNIARQNLLRRRRPLRALSNWAGIVRAAFGADPWDTLEELLDEEQAAGFRSTWFFAVRRGKGISYGPEELRKALRLVASRGQEIGLHGQSPDDGAALAAEAEELAQLSGQEIRGLRMHYLRLSTEVLDGMERAGLSYDSTVMDRSELAPESLPLPGPRRVREDLLELPLHVMDSTLFSVTGLGLDLAGARKYLRCLCDRAAESSKVIMINLHPNNFSSQEPDQKAWYQDLLGELSDRSDAFLTDARGLVERIRPT